MAVKFDPFKAWQEYQLRQSSRHDSLLREDLDVAKLHDPEDYVKEVNEFITETSAHIKALQDASHNHDVPLKNPRFGAALDKLADAFEELKQEASQLSAPPLPSESGYGEGKLFRK